MDYRTSIILILFFGLTLPSLSQPGIASGFVTDKETGEKIPYVTVYVNGTTIGTTTDEGGFFELKNIPLPCELIFSHVSYNVHRIQIDEGQKLSGLKIRLKKRLFNINELTVIGKNERDKYLLHFNYWLLGDDHKELGCEILNDSVIRFIPLEGGQFEAYATQPLEVILSEHGYTLKIDLVHFKLMEKIEVGGLHCSVLGYFYFEELNIKSRREQRKIARNRVRAYYNSRLHFCRSLYQNKLDENGYVLTNRYGKPAEEEQSPGSTGNYKFWYSNSESESGILYFTGFVSPYFYIDYYHILGNRPADLTELDGHPSNLSKSGIYFDSDTISVYSSGRVGENNMLFDGTIGDKRVAWMLPFDYIPSMQ